MPKTFRKILLLEILVVSAACGAVLPGGQASNSDTAGPAAAGVVVTLAPLSAQVAPGGTVSFAGSATGSADTGIAWSVQEGASGGFVSESGVYSAPAAEGTFHVVAASRADPSKRQVATVTVASGGANAVGVTVGPSAPTVDACQSVAFTATVSGSANQTVTWSVKEGLAGGTVTPEGVYTAPSSPGTYHVVATSLAEPAWMAEGSVTVGAEKVLAVAVATGSGTVAPNGALAVSAMVTTTCGTFAAQ